MVARALSTQHSALELPKVKTSPTGCGVPVLMSLLVFGDVLRLVTPQFVLGPDKSLLTLMYTPMKVAEASLSAACHVVTWSDVDPAAPLYFSARSNW